MNKNIIDKTAYKYGRLLVIEYSHSEKYSSKHKKHNSRSYWRCLCKCGNEVIVRSDSLSSGNSKSCGCIQKEYARGFGKRRSRPSGKAYLKMLFSQIKYRAKKMNKAMRITENDFYNLIKGKCHYCNTPPNQRRKNSYNGDFVHHGIDRVDNNKGYTKTNTVPCCKLCNSMKMNLSKNQFINHIRRILSYENSRNKV